MISRAFGGDKITLMFISIYITTYAGIWKQFSLYSSELKEYALKSISLEFHLVTTEKSIYSIGKMQDCYIPSFESSLYTWIYIVW